ncbi:MAG: arginine--tRNA ligase [Candidatus Woesearchaeota archaeon]
MDLKSLILDSINFENIEGINRDEVSQNLTMNSNSDLGDFSLPCFVFSKKLKKSPNDIAQLIKAQTDISKELENVKTVNGYLNFYLKKDKRIFQRYIDNVLNIKQDYFKNKSGEGKTICIDYSSVNLAKYMHIGHLATTFIGESVARLFEGLGYKIVRINYVGDYGTPFGKMVTAYKLWGNKEDILKRKIEATQELYVEFVKQERNNPELLQKARETFKNIENKKGEDYEIYKWFLEISKEEAKNILTNKLGVEFDSWKGESSYNDDIEDVVTRLKQKNLLQQSQGAQIINLEKEDLGIVPVLKKDDSSLYITRDIAAAKDRFERYNYDKMFYVTAIEQKLHFQQLFKILEKMNYPFSKNLEHISYGIISLPSGKLSSRYGKQATIEDLLKISQEKVEKLIEKRQFNIETRENIVKNVAKSTLAFTSLRTDRRKDTIFDPKKAFTLEGDTAPYILYTYARLKSIMRKHKNNANADYSKIPKNDSIEIIKQIESFKYLLSTAVEKREPSIIVRKAFDLTKIINKFYTNHRVLDNDNKDKEKAMINLLKIAVITLDYMFHIMCFDKLEEM